MTNRYRTIEAALRDEHSEWLGRCDWCGWTLAATVDKGCVEDNCSLRPLPAFQTDVAEIIFRYRRSIRKLLAALALPEREQPPCPDCAEMARQRDHYRAERDRWMARADAAEAEVERLREQCRLATIDQANTEAELNDLRSDLARVTAQRDAYRRAVEAWDVFDAAECNHDKVSAEERSHLLDEARRLTAEAEKECAK